MDLKTKTKKFLSLSLLTISMLFSATLMNAQESRLTLANIYKDAVNPLVEDSELLSAVFAGNLKLNIRVGYEYTDLNDADTTTPENQPGQEFGARYRLSYKSGSFMNTSFFVQAQYLGVWINEYAKSTSGNDFIADPDGFRWHQAYIDMKWLPDTTLRLGRQEILLDDVRFIGNVGWRQNAQSFDAVSITNKSIDKLTLFAAYAESVNTIFLTNNEDLEYYIYHAQYDFNKQMHLSTFAYLRTQNNDTHTDTYGARLWGKESKTSYDISGAAQDGSEYFHVYGGYQVCSAAELGMGYMYASGGTNTDDRFSTLDGTAHGWNGWADQFLGTGGGLEAGLADHYIQAKAKVLGGKVVAQYHIFRATDEESATGFEGEYGTELDLLFKRKINTYVTGLIKYAYYNKTDAPSTSATAGGRDEQILWARLMIGF